MSSSVNSSAGSGSIVEGGYTACKFHLSTFDCVPKLKSVTSRTHDVHIQAEELEAIQIALEDQLSWVTRRSLCLGSNLEVLNNGSSAQPVQLNSNSIFPYLAQSPSTSAACALRNNNPIQNLTGGGGMSPFKLDVTTHAINSPSSTHCSPSRGGSNRKESASVVSASSSGAHFSSISPVESLTKAKSETPAHFWKYLDATYCANITSDNVQKYLVALAKTYDDEAIAPLFEVPELGCEAKFSDSGSNSEHSNNNDESYSGAAVTNGAHCYGGSENGIPYKRSKLTPLAGKRSAKDNADTPNGKGTRRNGKQCGEDASRYSENICAIGPLTQLIISSLVKASNESTAEDHNNLVSKKSSDGKAQSSESEEGDYKLFDWQKSRQDCRMENELRKELMKIGFLEDSEEHGPDPELKEEPSSYSSDKLLPTMKVACADEVLSALRSKQCRLDLLIDANKGHLYNLYQKSQARIQKQELEAKADSLDAKLKDQYAKILTCKANKKMLSKKDHDYTKKLLAEWKQTYSSLELL